MNWLVTERERYLLFACSFMAIAVLIFHISSLNLISFPIEIILFILNFIVSFFIYAITKIDHEKNDNHLIKFYSFIFVMLIFFCVSPYVVSAMVVDYNQTKFINSTHPLDYDVMMQNYTNYVGKKVEVSGKVSDLTSKGDVNILTLNQNDAKDCQIVVFTQGDLKIKSGNELTVYGIVIEQSEILRS